MTEPDLDYSRYAADLPTDGDFSTLGSLVEQLLEAEKEVAKAEAELSRKQQLRDTLANHDIPELWDKMRLEGKVKIAGMEITVVSKVRCSPPVANRELCWSWLDEHGHGGMIKRNVIVAFDRGEYAEANRLIDELREAEYDVRQDQKVEPATMTAFANEMWKRDQEERVPEADRFPMALFGASEFKTTKIKVPRD